MRFTTYCILIFSLFLAIPAKAASPIIMERGREAYPVGAHMELLVDPEQKYNLSQVAGNQLTDMFFPPQGQDAGFGFTSAAYWLRFSIVNNNPDHRRWILALDSPVLDEAEFFLVSPDGLITYQIAGDAVPRGERSLIHHFPVFNFQAPPGQQLTCYLRLSCEDCALSAPLTLWTESAFWRQDRLDGIYYGVFIGCIAGLMLYNLFFFVSLRDRNYLFLFIFLLMFIFWQIHRQGWAYEFMGTAWPWWNSGAVLFFMGLMLFWGAFFLREFLDSSQVMPTLDRLFLVVMIAALLVTFTSIFVFRWANILGHLTGALLVILTLPASLMGSFRGDRPSRFVLAAWLFIALGGLVSLLVAPVFDSPWLANGQRIGLVVAVALLCLALTERSLINVGQSGDTLALEIESRSADLKEAVRKFHALVDSTRYPVYILNLEARFDFVTPSVEDQLGYAPPELIGRHLPSLIHHEDVDRFTDIFWKLAAGQIKTAQVEFRCRHALGKWRRLLTSPTAVQNNQGQTMHVLGELYDITGQKECEATVEKLQKQLDLILDALDGDLWEAGLKTGRIEFLQTTGLAALGYPPEEVPSDLQSFFKLVHPDDLPGFLETLESFLPDASGYYQARLRLHAKSGSYVTYHAVWQALSWDRDYTPIDLKGLFYTLEPETSEC